MMGHAVAIAGFVGAKERNLVAAQKLIDSKKAKKVLQRNPYSISDGHTDRFSLTEGRRSGP